MSNLYRGQTGNQYTRVIDNNEILEQKLSALALEQRQKAEKAVREAAKMQDGDDGEELSFREGILAPQFEVSPEFQIDYVEHAKEEATRIVAKATRDAEEILRKAAEEAENLKESARESAASQGYADGRNQAEAEAGQMRQELESLRREQELDYQQKLQQMEAELVPVIIQVFDKVFHIEFEKKQDILLHLIQQTVQQVKNSHEYRIRVSAQDYAYICEQKQTIVQKVGGDIILDILSDESLSEGLCTIDTEEGIFDCSIEVELENLIKDLRALSCMG